MAILNITPDSFSDGGQLQNIDEILQRARSEIRQGAEILDIGGESTRPGAQPVDEETELRRVIPVVEAVVAQKWPVLISVDTSKAVVAEAALAAGAHIVNDVSALGDPHMGRVVARYSAQIILMHMRGEPRTMQQEPIEYSDVMGDVVGFLGDAVERAKKAGISEANMMLDPGIGFGKNTLHNLQITNQLSALLKFDMPIVYGASRKRFLGEITGKHVSERDVATAGACVVAVLKGAQVLRVHNCAAVRDAVQVAWAMYQRGDHSDGKSF